MAKTSKANKRKAARAEIVTVNGAAHMKSVGDWGVATYTRIVDRKQIDEVKRQAIKAAYDEEVQRKLNAAEAVAIRVEAYRADAIARFVNGRPSAEDERAAAHKADVDFIRENPLSFWLFGVTRDLTFEF